MADISFKNADGSARNTPRVLAAHSNTDSKDGSVQHVVEEVDVSAIQRIEEEAKHAIDALLDHTESE